MVPREACPQRESRWFKRNGHNRNDIGSRLQIDIVTKQDQCGSVNFQANNGELKNLPPLSGSLCEC